jgi:hypothetical protein
MLQGIFLFYMSDTLKRIKEINNLVERFYQHEQIITDQIKKLF